MKKNIFFQTVYRRDNLFKNFIFDSAMKVASYPKMLLEVFIRKNFGERYFKLATAITVAVIMFFLPFFIEAYKSLNDRYDNFGARERFWSHYWSWFVFIVAFVTFSIIRWREVKRNPSVFDFARFSLYSGDMLPILNSKVMFGKRLTDRTVEIFIEPALFIIPGVLLFQLGQNIGLLMIYSGIFYGLSYAGQYKKGDDFVMDKIDEMILNEEMESAFVDDETADNTRGVRFYSRKPNAKTLRKKLTDSFVETDAPEEEITYAN